MAPSAQVEVKFASILKRHRSPGSTKTVLWMKPRLPSKLSDILFRSQQPHWDHHAEVQAFSSRLHENFSLEVLKTAFINPCYLQAEHRRRQRLAVGAEATALALEDNVQLRERGESFTRSFLTDWCTASFPVLPSDGVESVARHLAGSEVVTYVARNLGVDDLAMSADCPVPDDVLHSTFMAVVGALLESSGPERTGLFLRVRVLLQSIMHTQYLISFSHIVRLALEP